MGNRQANVNIRKIKNSLTAFFQCIFWEFLWKQNVLNNKAHKFLESKYNFITYILYITMNKIKEGAKKYPCNECLNSTHYDQHEKNNVTDYQLQGKTT